MLPTLAPNILFFTFLSSLQKMLFAFITEGKLALEMFNNKFGEAFLGKDVVALAAVGQPGAARWDRGAVLRMGCQKSSMKERCRHSAPCLYEMTKKV